MRFATGDDVDHLLRVARGDAPADEVLRASRLVNVFTGEAYDADVALAGGRVAGIGPGYEGDIETDLAGGFLVPGLIDAHVHIESSMVPPHEFARAVVPRGVTTVVTDPHEIANVLGSGGIRYMLSDAAGAPMTMIVNAPSCVPATGMATSGARLSAADLAELATDSRILGLAEVMNFPGVVHADGQVMAKLRAFRGRVIDGHAPGLAGHALCAYVAAGPSSDHEATTVHEAREKLRLGMRLFLREATNAHNLVDLVPAVTGENAGRVCLCTDDRQPDDLLGQGSVDHLLRLAIRAGVSPVAAVRMATLNTAEHYALADVGAIVPGRWADLVVTASLEDFQAEVVYRRGQVVARDGALVVASPGADSSGVRDTVRVDWGRVDLRIPASGRRIRAIGVVPDQLVTEALVVDATVVDGLAVADPGRDLAKMAVIERHRASGKVGLGFVSGIGLGRGAIAGTVAHDHHNLVVIGCDDGSMLRAARAVAESGGGLAVAAGDEVLGVLPLPIAGLMSDAAIGEVREILGHLTAAARDLGSRLHDPFMAMSFLALEVIPSLKLTDQGLVDVDRYEVVPLWAEE